MRFIARIFATPLLLIVCQLGMAAQPTFNFTPGPRQNSQAAEGNGSIGGGFYTHGDDGSNRRPAPTPPPPPSARQAKHAQAVEKGVPTKLVELGLAPEQLEKMRAIRLDAETRANARNADATRARTVLMRSVETGEYSKAKAEQAANEISKATTDFFMIHAEAYSKMVAVLTPNQRERLK